MLCRSLAGTVVTCALVFLFRLFYRNSGADAAHPVQRSAGPTSIPVLLFAVASFLAVRYKRCTGDASPAPFATPAVGNGDVSDGKTEEVSADGFHQRKVRRD